MMLTLMQKLFPMMVFEGEGGGGGGTAAPPAAPPANQPPQNQPPAAESEVEKAYRKLREAEAERDQYKGQVQTFEREKLPEADRIKAERDQEKQRAQTAETELANFKTRVSVTEAAREAGFRSPTVAVDLLMYRKVDLSTKEKTAKALADLAQEDPSMVTNAPPSGGPINPQNGTETASSNAGFNNAIRRASGRPVA